jgi:P27 family predicted phage terminase small subunit
LFKLRADSTCSAFATPKLREADKTMPANRKDKALHDLHGTLPNGRAADVLAHVPSGRPKIPRDIGPGLRKTFKHLCSLLQERRTLTRADSELIRLYCIIYERHEKNVAKLREEGELTEYTRLDSHGKPHQQVKLNLRLKVCEASEKQMASLLNQLGLTPTASSRAKPTSTGQEEIVKGSIADLMPHLLTGKPSPVVEFVPPSFDLAAMLVEQAEADLAEEDDATIR